MDIVAIHAFLTQSYWSPGVPLDLVQQAVAHSLPFGVFCGDAQVGFARVITDQTSFAYLADVYVLPEHRGRGLSKRLMQQVLDHPALQGLRRFMLATRDAHGLYAQFGFATPAQPDRLMERRTAPAWLKPA
jgi:GNAT superfamily N-acetyltransferase